VKGIEHLALREIDGGVVVPVKAVPGASRDRVVGVLGDCLKIATARAAEKGKANQGIAAILAKVLGVRTADVTLVSGAMNPRKEFRVDGRTASDVREALAKR